MISARAIVCSLVLCLSGSLSWGAESPPETKAATPFFPLFAWWTPPPTPEDFKTYADAHLNTMLVQADVSQLPTVQLAHSGGLRVLLVDPYRNGMAAPDWIRYADSFPGVIGWLVRENVTAENISSAVGDIQQLRSYDRTRSPFVVLPSSETGAAWADMASKLLQAGMQALCCRRLSLYEDGTTDQDGFYGDLDRCRRLSLQTRTSLWGMIQVSQQGPYRSASESDIRFQVYSYLAAGAKGICYHTYWGPSQEGAEADAYPGWGYSMVDRSTHRPLYPWEKVEEVNREVLALAPVLLGLKNQKIYFVGPVPKGGVTLPPDAGPIRSVSAETAMIGILSDAQNQTWVMIVNRRHGKQLDAESQTSAVRVSLDPKVNAVIEISRVTGEESRTPVDQGQLSVRLPGGTGGLFRLEMATASPGAGGQP